jgi:hypothetical protein
MTITTMKGVGTPRRQAIGETGTHTPQVATAMPRRYCPHFRIIVTAFHRHQPGPYIEAERTPIVFDLSRQRLRTTARKIIALCAGLVIACIGPPGCYCASQFSTTVKRSRAEPLGRRAPPRPPCIQSPPISLPFSSPRPPNFIFLSLVCCFVVSFCDATLLHWRKPTAPDAATRRLHLRT